MRQLILFLLMLPLSSFGQTDYDMDELARNTPASKTYSVEDLAQYFSKSIADDRGRIRAIYAWVTLNIRYVDTGNGSQIWASPEHLERQRPANVLKNRTAVCQGISNLFQALCQASGILCQVVPGIVKDYSGAVMPVGHAWVAAMVKGQWRLFDPTWSLRRPGQNWEVNDHYFMVPPEQFVLNHLPDDPAWQLLENPILETEFREHDHAYLQARLKEKPDELFNFRDTLQNWVALDSAERAFAAESRVLRFNGSNQRVLFGLGQSYWGLFFDLRDHLDTLADRSILLDSIEIDTAYFLHQWQLMQIYHQRARSLFAQITDPARIAMTERFYSPQDVEAVSAQLLGSMWSAVFENEFARNRESIHALSLQRLESIAATAAKAYQRAQDNLNCQKLRNQCFDIWHNLSLMHLQLAERHTFFAQNMLDGKNAHKWLKDVEATLIKAHEYYALAASETQEMRKIPPPYAFVLERLQTARQGPFTLKVLALRARRIALNQSVEQALATGAPTGAANGLSPKLQAIAQELEDLAVSMEDAIGDLGTEFSEISLDNIQQERYALLFNLGNLQFRTAYELRQIAAEKNTLATERNKIQQVGQKGLNYLKEAGQSLELLQKSTRTDRQTLAQKALQVNKLAKTIQVFLADL